MAKVILGTTMSVDGFINDRNGSVEALYSDLAALRETEPLQVPIFILTHRPPEKHPKENSDLTFTFVTDGIESAIQQAKAAAGDKDVTVIGAASTAMQCLRAGLADELHIDIMSVLLGDGLRFFEDGGLDEIQLERTKVVELPGGRTHLEFRIIK